MALKTKIWFSAMFGLSILVLSAAGLNSYFQKNEISIPPAHLKYVRQAIFKTTNKCTEATIEAVLSSGINLIDLNSSGLKASVFQFTFECAEFGHIWSTTGSVYTLILIGDQVYETFLHGEPSTLKLGRTVILLPLDPTQCVNFDQTEPVVINKPCHGIVLWDEELETLIGHGHMIKFIEFIHTESAH